MNLPIYIVNAFTKHDFSGNPAAVVIINDWLDEPVMQNIAAQNNLSETAFIRAREPGRYDIRWFSPLTEIDFCGHASLASAYVLFNIEKIGSTVQFAADAVGEFTIEQQENGLITMAFAEQGAQSVDEVPQALIKGLSGEPLTVVKNRQAYIAVYGSEQDVRDLDYESETLKKLAPFDVCVTAPGDHTDFVCRYFWPANGGNEDPVTGSIHSALAPYWCQQLGKDKLTAKQVSPRTGELFCEIIANKVLVSGYGRLYLKGEISI